MIGMGAKSITIVRAVTADFFFDCRAAEVPSDEMASVIFYLHRKVIRTRELNVSTHFGGNQWALSSDWLLFVIAGDLYSGGTQFNSRLEYRLS
jgi:hypothetical protein